MTEEEVYDLYLEYVATFDEEPPVCYPDSIDSPLYVSLMKEALEKGKPYTDEDLFKKMKLKDEDLV